MKDRQWATNSSSPVVKEMALTRRVSGTGSRDVKKHSSEVKSVPDLKSATHCVSWKSYINFMSPISSPAEWGQ